MSSYHQWIREMEEGEVKDKSFGNLWRDVKYVISRLTRVKNFSKSSLSKLDLKRYFFAINALKSRKICSNTLTLNFAQA